MRNKIDKTLLTKNINKTFLPEQILLQTYQMHPKTKKSLKQQSDIMGLKVYEINMQGDIASHQVGESLY